MEVVPPSLHTVVVAHQRIDFFLKHVSFHLFREVYSRKNGKNAVHMVHKDSNTSESLEDIIEFFGRRNCDARALFDALMKRKLLLSSIDNLTAGVQALCRLGWSDLAVHLYNAAGGSFIICCAMPQICDTTLVLEI